MKTVFQAIRDLVDFLDSQGKLERPIKVRSSRAYLMKEFKPVVRGGPVMCKGHELQPIERDSGLSYCQVDLL
jgi:hypothetical protein